ncbi:hypothetical protein [Streptomyces sp. OV198]|uniref:hypothetical protein n=1 Tax=Streptomyces sp. OV198 TaxID=1882787 RepID=UPI000BE3FE07|nr:hypothetical protein [Streptomyces sp. OV198]
MAGSPPWRTPTPSAANCASTPPRTQDRLTPGPACAPGELRRALIGVKRSALIRLRDQRIIDDIVRRRPQAVLDSEEIRIELALRAFTGRAPSPPAGDTADTRRRAAGE